MNQKCLVLFIMSFVLLGLAARAEEGRRVVTPTLPCPLGPDADLWLLGGQSNMEGQDFPDPQQSLDARIMNFDMSNQWMVAQDPIHRLFEAKAAIHQKLLAQWLGPEPEKAARTFKAFHADLLNHPRGVGPGLAFAQAIVQATGRPVGLIPCAHGGSSMQQWDPALKGEGDNSLYGALCHRLEMVGGRVRGLLWYQGESDSGDPATTEKFEARFLNFVDAIRRDTGQPDLPVIYVQIGRWALDQPAAAGFERIRELQRLAAGKRKNLYFTTAIDQPLYDPAHVSRTGQQALGRRMAEIALTNVYHVAGHGQMIDLESITVPNPRDGFPVIHLHFKGVTGKLHAAGRPSSYQLCAPAPQYTLTPRIYRVDFDPQDPAGLNLIASTPLVGPVKLIGGGGLDPMMNVVDDRDMPLPAFGPLDVPITTLK